MSSLVIPLKPADEIATGLRRAITSRGLCWSRAVTAAVFSAERVVHRLPELPLLRLRLVPVIRYFLTFRKTVLLAGGFRPGNVTRKAFCTAAIYFVSGYNLLQ